MILIPNQTIPKMDSYIDMADDALVPRRKTIADIMPLAQAVIAHKMKPRSVKRDRTKTPQVPAAYEAAQCCAFATRTVTHKNKPLLSFSHFSRDKLKNLNPSTVITDCNNESRF